MLHTVAVRLHHDKKSLNYMAPDLKENILVDRSIWRKCGTAWQIYVYVYYFLLWVVLGKHFATLKVDASCQLETPFCDAIKWQAELTEEIVPASYNKSEQSP